MLKIATWNLERPRSSSSKNKKVIEEISKINADIVILTETNSAIDLTDHYSQVSTDLLSAADAAYYTPGEKRTTIWSKVPASSQVSTYDSKTAACAILPTPLGELIVYGTVIGVLGNRRPSFHEDLTRQISDWKRLAQTGNLCIAGDFNQSFIDSYYYTKSARELLVSSFEHLEIINLTQSIKNNIDHIAVSKSFIKDIHHEVATWNEDKKLSDHIGVCAILIP